MISAPVSILINHNQVFSPGCGADFVLIMLFVLTMICPIVVLDPRNTLFKSCSKHSDGKNKTANYRDHHQNVKHPFMYGCGFGKCCYSNPDAVQAMVYTGDNDQHLSENEHGMFDQTQESIVSLGTLSQLP